MIISRKKTRTVDCGGVKIGGTSPISIQTMCNIDTQKTIEIIEQIREIEKAGGQIVRLAVPNEESARSFGEIAKKSPLPLVADIHFDYRLALIAIEKGASKIRINPGNIGSTEKIKKIALAARKQGIPIRVGVNSGSLEREILRKHGGVTPEGLWESAKNNASILEQFGFYDIVLSLKSSDPVLNYRAYKLAATDSEYPLHIGVTESGSSMSGEIKSSVGIGALLLEGIGNTLRVSLTESPTREIEVAKEILSAAGISKKPINIISCPTCGRTRVDLSLIVSKVEKALMPVSIERDKLNLEPIDVAIMGCAVNGPGEAKNAHLGVACGNGEGLIFSKGRSIRKVSEDKIAAELVNMVRNYGRDLG